MRPEEQLAGFLARYTPEIAARAGALLEAMRSRLPGAIELVYDNYNALVIGFGPTERPSDATLSIAVYPRLVRLHFLRGAELSDPDGVLLGTGKVNRSLIVDSPADLGAPAVSDLIDQAVRQAGSWDRSRRGQMVIRSVSDRQRARRPRDRPEDPGRAS